MNEADVKSKLRQWIIQRSKQGIRPEDLSDETPVIESGLLSSLDIVEFVLFIESLLGDEIDLDDLEPEVFNNTNSIYQAFFGE